MNVQLTQRTNGVLKVPGHRGTSKRRKDNDKKLMGNAKTLNNDLFPFDGVASVESKEKKSKKQVIQHELD